MSKTFIMREEWVQNISKLPLEMQDKIIAEIVRYGIRQDTVYDDDPIIFSIVNGYKGSIDRSINDYEQKIEMSKTAGRKKKVDDKVVYDLAKMGKTAQEVADELCVSKSAIDKNEGWKHRKEEFVF
jgi:hypothetical protein